MQSLHLNLQFKGYGYIVEADIKGFFNNMDHQWLMRMLALRIDDKALLCVWCSSESIRLAVRSEKPALAAADVCE